jgi:hypothetical protein
MFQKNKIRNAAGSYPVFARMLIVTKSFQINQHCISILFYPLQENNRVGRLGVRTMFLIFVVEICAANMPSYGAKATQSHTQCIRRQILEEVHAYLTEILAAQRFFVMKVNEFYHRIRCRSARMGNVLSCD